MVATLVALSTTLIRGAEGEGGARPPGPAVGVQVHGAWSDWSARDVEVVLDQLEAAGVGWIRLDVGWTSVEGRGRGRISPWYVRRVDRVVDAAARRGIRVLAMLWATPPWANGGAGRTTAPRAARDYARIAGWAAARYRGRVDAWQVWNEPNRRQFFASTDPEAYVRILRPAYRAIKRGDPRATVVLAGPAYNDTAWLEAVYRAGAGGHFDVLATHPYPVPADSPPERSRADAVEAIEEVAQVRALMVRRNDADLPIWFTELGWSTHRNTPETAPWERGVSRRTQGDYMVRTLRLLRQRHPYVENVFWYTARDRATGDPHLDNYGLLTRAMRPKPAYERLRAHLRPPAEVRSLP